MIFRLLILCNAFDDQTRIERGVSTDSPAGSRKVFLLAKALRKGGVRAWVLSLGRGRAGGRASFFRGVVRRIDGVPVIYAPFSTVPLLSELISLLALVPVVFRLNRRGMNGALFYNRMLAYLPALLLCSFLGFKRFLDLEDGEVVSSGGVVRRFGLRVLRRVFDALCSDGALLACSALKSWTSVRPTFCYYGTAIGDASPHRFSSDRLTVLMGGALWPETGADLLADAIERMRAAAPSWADPLQFEVTGQGSGLERFRILERSAGAPYVRVHGRTTDAEYREILARCDIGLALKLNAGSLAHTTFPSKVVEYAAAGMLVMTTDISDVRSVLGEQGAVFLTKDDPDLLCTLFREAIQEREQCRALALNGMSRVRELCDPAMAGVALGRFMFSGEA